MPSLRDLRERISSVKSTKKITSAMKMVAASKLKKAQGQAEAAQPYAQALGEVTARVASNIQITPTSSKLLRGTGQNKTHLLIVVSSDRGLCGGFNANIIRQTRLMTDQLLRDGKEVKLVCVGRKIQDAMNRTHADHVIKSFTGIGSQSKIGFHEARDISEYIVSELEQDRFDVATLMFNEFISVLTQQPKPSQLIPFKLPEAIEEEKAIGPKAQYAFEPNEEDILNELLPKNLSIQLYGALLDSAAGEQAARMTAMDAATRNAGEKIDDLTLQYNRARQAYITKELIEIISGAEAL